MEKIKAFLKRVLYAVGANLLGLVVSFLTTLLIPKYSDLWNAAGEVKQAMPLLKKVFGNQIDDEFLVQLHKRTMK